MNSNLPFQLATLCLLFCLPATVFAQKEEVGFNALVAEKGGALEDGSGIRVFQPEAPDGDGDYLVNVNDAQFAGKNIQDGTGSNTDFSSHANTVGRNFYGNSASMTPGITDVTGYEAGDYINNQLNFASGNDPNAHTFDIGNHSYVARTTNVTVAEAEAILERFDFQVNRDNIVQVVGADNGSGRLTPRLFAPSYNAITVGLSNGDHSQTLTEVYGTPRFATSIVVPQQTFTSFTTPFVASAAALLRDAGAGTNMVQNEVIRSTLWAGATKEEFATWDRTTTRPMDEVFGYGELNILHSYHIWEGGEFEASTSDPASNIGLLGWDYGDFNGSDELFYDFTIESGNFASELSAVLAWNIDITDTDPTANFTASRSLANLDLELFDSSGSFLGSLVDSSLSTDYNHEHIYLQNLAAGDYTFRITGDLATDYAFSWRIHAVPEPAAGGLLALLCAGFAVRRRRIGQAWPVIRS